MACSKAPLNGAVMEQELLIENHTAGTYFDRRITADGANTAGAIRAAPRSRASAQRRAGLSSRKCEFRAGKGLSQ